MFSNLKKNYFLLITTFLFLYFFFNFLDGERGLFSYFKVKELEFKNSLLTNNLDLDYIETLLRQKFLLGKDGEKFYIIKNHEN